MLTNWIVSMVAGTSSRTAARAGPRPLDRADSRSRILAAAGFEFAAAGFAGAGVDRIARRARLNKAMIYYHFPSKQALYEAVLGEMYVALRDRLREVAAGPGTPAEKIDAFIEALAREVEARPRFLPVILRELAEGGPRLGRQTLELIAGVFRALRGIVEEGVRAGTFAPVNPFLVVATIVGPIIMFKATVPVRARIGRLGIADMSVDEPVALVRHLQTVTRRVLSQAPPNA
jgi:TetR/AcrR family transcriptional regulator